MSKSERPSTIDAVALTYPENMSERVARLETDNKRLFSASLKAYKMLSHVNGFVRQYAPEMSAAIDDVKTILYEAAMKDRPNDDLETVPLRAVDVTNDTTRA